MATKWLSSSARGGDDGSDYANAWGALNDAMTWINTSAVKGDILNIVNDGDHTAPTAVTQFSRSVAGTDFDSDPGFTFRGTDAAGDPEMATFISAGVAFQFLYVRANAHYIVTEGLKFDMTAVPDTTGVKVCQFRDYTSGPVRFRNCYFKGWDDNDADTMKSLRRIWDYTSLAPDNYGEVSYCLIHNMAAPFEIGARNPEEWRCHHNVFWVVGGFLNTFKAAVDLRTFADAGHVHEFYNNTWYVDIDDTPPQLCGSGVASGDFGTVEFHSNVMFVESPANPAITRFWGSHATSTITWVGHVDYNIMYGGPSVEASDLTEHYSQGWQTAGGGGPEPNDVVAFETAASVLFNDPGTAYSWEGSGDGYTILVPGDVRLKLHTTAGLAGILPGALPPASTDYTVLVAATTLAPEVAETFDIAAKVANSGSAASALVLDVQIPAGLTYVSDSPDQGSYDSGTGLWNVGALASGNNTNLTLTVSVDSGQYGNDIVFTAFLDSATPGAGPPTSDDTASLTLSVLEEVIIDIEAPAAAPYIDVIPLVAPTMTLGMNVKLETVQSRQVELYERDDYEDIPWSEFTSKRIVLATNTTMEVNLGGIERGEYLLLDATEPIDVSAVRGDTQRYWANIKLLVIGRGDFEKIHIRNTSVLVTPTILVGVVN